MNLSGLQEVSVKTFGAKGDSVTDDTNAIKAAIAALTPGQYLVFPAGTYQVSEDIQLKSNVTLVGRGAILRDSAGDSSDLGVTVTGSANAVSNINITGFSFLNVRLEFTNNSPTIGNLSGISVEHSSFAAIRKDDDPLRKVGDIGVARASQVTLSNLSFDRKSRYFPGRGVNLWKVHGAVLEDSEWEGYYNQTLEIAGSYANQNLSAPVDDAERSVNICVRGNSVRRYRDDSVAGYETGMKDQGMYAHNARNVEFRNNVVYGFGGKPSIGAIKARNGENIIIKNNVVDASIFLFTYVKMDSVDPTKYLLPLHLKNVLVEGNTIVLTEQGDDGETTGLAYDREALPAGAGDAESGITISRNEVLRGDFWLHTNGSALDPQDFNVTSNKATSCSLPPALGAGCSPVTCNIAP